MIKREMTFGWMVDLMNAASFNLFLHFPYR